MESADELNREILLGKLVEAAPLIKKHNQHSRHVFNHLEKKYAIKIRTKNPVPREDASIASSQCSQQSHQLSQKDFALAPAKTLGEAPVLVYARPPQEQGVTKIKIKVPRKRNRKPKGAEAKE